MSFEMASLNRQQWQQWEVVFSALHWISEWKLEHVDELIVTYCKGALKTWSRFDTEGREEDPISQLTPENIEHAWLEVTNDGNESALGQFRQSAKSAPNMTLAYHNALRMYKANNTSEFAMTLTPDARQIVQAQTRKDDASGASWRDKHVQVVHMKDVRDKNVECDVTRQKRVDKAQEAIASTVAITSVEALEVAYLIAPRADRYLSVAALDLQLDWHLANPVPGLPGSEETSASSIPKAKTGPKGRGTRETRFEYLKQVISRSSRTTETPAADPSAAIEEEPVLLEVLSMDVDDGAYDSEEDFYGPRRGFGL